MHLPLPKLLLFLTIVYAIPTPGEMPETLEFDEHGNEIDVDGNIITKFEDLGLTSSSDNNLGLNQNTGISQTSGLDNNPGFDHNLGSNQNENLNLNQDLGQTLGEHSDNSNVVVPNEFGRIASFDENGVALDSNGGVIPLENLKPSDFCENGVLAEAPSDPMSKAMVEATTGSFQMKAESFAEKGGSVTYAPSFQHDKQPTTGDIVGTGVTVLATGLGTILCPIPGAGPLIGAAVGAVTGPVVGGWVDGTI